MNLFNKLKSIFIYIKSMGFNWFVFRIKYELLKKINYFDKVNKCILEKVKSQDENLFYYKKIGFIKKDFFGNKNTIQKADEALKANIFSFSSIYLDYSKDGKFNWHMNPISKIEADNKIAWNNLPDFGKYGDIKLIWEASRFPQIYFFINAYSIEKDEKYANACIFQILDWIAKNPYPLGVNYKCGQEISFRIFAWLNALEYFDEFISKEDEEKIVKNIYISLLRIDANIDYAAKSVKNNHSISEASGLLIGGLLFPQFSESKKFIKKGLKYLLKETQYQVYDDGSYIQHSFTYQRLVLDVLSFTFLIAQKKKFLFPIVLKQRYIKMVNFLNSFMQKDGSLPNYGSNDGANLFPIYSSDYRDFRKSIYFTLGKSIFFNMKSEEKTILSKKLEFDVGGYYIIKSKDIFSFIRCHTYKDRPSQNDMFHLDIWYKGKNIFCDAGSYSYNTNKEFKNNFIGVVGHNTIMINNSNQMDPVLNFGYSNWTKSKKIEFNKNLFLGENYAYKKRFSITHERRITLNSSLIIVDNIKNVSELTNIKQIWNTKEDIIVIDEYSLKVENCIISSNVKYNLEKSYISDYYNSYVIGTRIVFEVDTYKDFKIKTKMEFN